MSGNISCRTSGGSTATLSNTLAGVLAAASQSMGVDRIYGMRNGIEGFLSEDFIDITDVTPRLLDALRSTPSAALGSCRYALSETDAARVLAVLKAHDVRYFIYIGGNGSALTVQAVDRWAREDSYTLSAIAAPKTIDNDLWGTDHTPRLWQRGKVCGPGCDGWRFRLMGASDARPGENPGDVR